MYSSYDKSVKHIGIFVMGCPYCGQHSNFQLSLEETSGFIIFPIPRWGHNYYVTCGSCFTTFKIDNKIGEQIEFRIAYKNDTGRDFDQPNSEDME